MPASALGDTADRIRANVRWEYENLPYWDGETDVCINASTLASGAWLGTDVEPIVAFFTEHQLADGGWNCEWVEGSTRSSFHSTLNALRGMLAWEQLTGRDDLREVRLRGQEYLLERRLLTRASTGERVGPWVEHLVHPVRWIYTALGALDHLRNAGVHDGVAPDPRAADAVAVVREARRDDGTWAPNVRLAGERWFEVDVEKGEPSPWLTFTALRALHWWDEAHDGEA
ncbi:hypothetical protein GCM10025875_27700 [Litorihabitans aurantiacus]|uniref:Squalene cyclase n=1 Tax=Litorihabitans aurantiacus TaxID=1930061 RepID=A0AA37XGK4_9MICO|nr:hypothetical protein GCM10025875_27700 [Litorihabitans aurantiacus]